MPFPDWRAGAKVTAALLKQQQVNIITPTTLQSKASITTPSADNELTFAIEANATYVVEFVVVFTSISTAVDLRTQWSVPAGAAGTRMCFGSTSNSATATTIDDTKALVVAQTFTTNVVYQIFDQSAQTGQLITEIATVRNGGTAGSITFLWAQDSSSATNLSRLASNSSYVRYTRYA